MVSGQVGCHILDESLSQNPLNYQEIDVHRLKLADYSLQNRLSQTIERFSIDNKIQFQIDSNNKKDLKDVSLSPQK